MNTKLNPSTETGSIANPCLAVALRRASGQPVLGRESVTSDDLQDAVSETWRDCHLRAGRLDLAETDMALRVNPQPSTTGEERLSGFALETTPLGMGGGKRRAQFSIHAVQSAAQRCQDHLRSSGILTPGETVYYELERAAPEATRASEIEGAAGPDVMQVTFRNPPLCFLKVPLAPLLEKARQEGEARPEAFPVIYTEQSLAKAEAASRKGAVANSSHESGAVVAGFLCSCPDTGEFFPVVTDCFEVTDAESSLTSLEYTGKSWAQIQTVIKARQRVDPAVRILGQAHGHNFLPNDGQTCAECPKLEVCSSSNVFASADDRQWTRAVFAHQPWALCHIFGLTARGDLEQGLFTLHDGRLQERAFQVVPDFDPGRYPTLTINR